MLPSLRTRCLSMEAEGSTDLRIIA
jgi:hypothetical protein